MKYVSSQASLFENGDTVKTASNPPIPDYELATVTYSEGITKNMGNYESFKFSISVTLPCHKNNVLGVYKKLKHKVHDLLLTRLVELGLNETTE